MNINDVNIGQKISFELYPAHIYGNNFRNVTLTALIDSTLANALGFDVVAAHQNVYPSLPAGTPNDPTQYSYFRVSMDNGETMVLGTPWVRESSIVINSGNTLTMVFQDIDEARKNRIIAACRANNETPDHVTFV